MLATSLWQLQIKSVGSGRMWSWCWGQLSMMSCLCNVLTDRANRKGVVSAETEHRPTERPLQLTGVAPT